ncbi:MAG: hypothetical protein MZV64_17935 [Ignavibacteriales bacterium]|nr:hypothetical protein [Ignavibacteriales bacterium]
MADHAERQARNDHRRDGFVVRVFLPELAQELPLFRNMPLRGCKRSREMIHDERIDGHAPGKARGRAVQTCKAGGAWRRRSRSSPVCPGFSSSGTTAADPTKDKVSVCKTATERKQGGRESLPRQHEVAPREGI